MLPRLITKLGDVKRLVERIYEAGNAFTFDFETVGTRVMRLKVAGLGFAWGPGEDDGAYIVTDHVEHPTVPWRKVVEVVKPLFEDEGMTMVSHNSLFDVPILLREGINVHTNAYDTLVMAWLLNTDTPNGLKGLIHRRYGYQMNELSQFVPSEVVSWHPGKVLRLDKAPMDVLESYAIDDVRWTFRLWRDALDALDEVDLLGIYNDLYREYLVLLAQMEVDGIRLDTNFLHEREVATQNELDDLRREILTLRPGEDFPAEVCADWTAADIDVQRKHIPALQEKWRDRATMRSLLYEHPTLAHKVFNPGSNKQLNKILFQEIGLTPIGEKGVSGDYSVKSEVMAKLRHKDPTGMVERLQRYSMLSTLQDNFHIGLQALVDDDGRIRTHMNAALKTGRLAASQPNLMNIPARTAEGKLIRQAFIPRDGFQMVDVDYSQLEMRIVAHVSGDESLIEGFKRGADPHSITASVMFKDQIDCDLLDIKEKYPMYRAIAKTLNFANLYGAGPERLANSVADATNGEVMLSIDEARDLRETLLSAMPAVGSWIAYQERFVQRTGKVFTLIGRPRHLPGALDASDRRNYFGSLRRAVNSPIQGSAADLIGIATRNLRRRLLESGDWRTSVFLLQQIHDELLFEVREDRVEWFLPIVKHEMENALPLNVPIEAEPSVGSSWLAAK